MRSGKDVGYGFFIPLGWAEAGSAGPASARNPLCSCTQSDDPKPEAKSRIVGVVTNVRQALREPQMAEMDWLMDEIAPKDRMQSLNSMALIVRSNGDLTALVPALRNAVHEIDPTVPFRTPETISDIVSDSLTLDRLEGWLFGIFAALALLLAVIGLYGLVNHEVELRTREIGIRMALGSTRIQVTNLLLGKVGLLLVSGLAMDGCSRSLSERY